MEIEIMCKIKKNVFSYKMISYKISKFSKKFCK